MSARVQVALDHEGAVAVKVASTDDEATRLQLEVERIRRAAHPGVVSLLAVQPPTGGGTITEMRTRFAGESLDRWRGSLTCVAGLGAAVASILADLHSAGIVHGRLDRTHVLLGADGRPRLCGLSGRQGATPADDVADLADILDHLAAGATPAPWHRRRRAAAARRALDAVLRDARDPVADRRLSAAALADALLVAVPGAELPRPAQPEAGTKRSGTVIVVPTPAGGADPTGRAEPTEAPESDGSDGSPGPNDTDPAPAAEPYDDFWSSGADLDRFSDDIWAADEDELADVAVPPPDGAVPDASLPPAAWTATRPTRGRHDPAPGDEAVEPLPRRSPLPPRPRRPPAGSGADGPRAAGRPGPRVLPGAAVLLVVVSCGAAGIAFARHPSPAAEDTGPGRSGATPVGSAGRCPEVAPPAADVDGDGCPEPIHLDGRTVTAGDPGGARWSIGQPGDLAALGDWDCDGEATPALLRPSTGEVFVFREWAAEGDPLTVAPVERVPGGVGIGAEPTGDVCDRLVVDLATGGTIPVSVPGDRP